MKVILSRKGFDLKHGGMPSPILPDGTLLLLPQPNEIGYLKYDELFYDNQSYLDIITSLKPKLSTTLKHAKCFPNPDIQKGIYLTPPDWKPAYGQYGPSESHLDSQHVSVGDIFLFYGWFRQTEYANDGTLRFISDAPDLHVIFGYLQIGAIIKNNNYIAKKYHWHTNAHIDNSHKKHNTIYIPTKKLSYNNQQRGYGLLRYSQKLVLTKEGAPYSRWNLPDFFRRPDVTISYHNNITNGFIPGKDYFQSSPIGQEFVINGTFDLKDWVHQLIIDDHYSLRYKDISHKLNTITHINHPDCNGKVYCRKKNKIIEIDSTACKLCKGLRNILNDNTVECCWKDYAPFDLDSFQVTNPSEEYQRVNWLIEKQFIPNSSELE